MTEASFASLLMECSHQSLIKAVYIFHQWLTAHRPAVCVYSSFPFKSHQEFIGRVSMSQNSECYYFSGLKGTFLYNTVRRHVFLSLTCSKAQLCFTTGLRLTSFYFLCFFISCFQDSQIIV